jgi:intraflagellar transport protein 80
MQAGLIYRAVKLHVRLHNWQRALDLAVKHKQHLDTVLMYRQRCVTQ